MPGKQQNIPYYAVFKAINIGRLVLDGIDNFGKVPLAQDTADKLCGVVSSLIVWIYGTVNIYTASFFCDIRAVSFALSWKSARVEKICWTIFIIYLLCRTSLILVYSLKINNLFRASTCRVETLSSNLFTKLILSWSLVSLLFHIAFLCFVYLICQTVEKISAVK